MGDDRRLHAPGHIGDAPAPDGGCRTPEKTADGHLTEARCAGHCAHDHLHLSPSDVPAFTSGPLAAWLYARALVYSVD